MPSWLLLIISILCCTAVVPLFVLGASSGDWRKAWQAWKQYALILLGLAAAGIVAALLITLLPPRP